MILVPVTDDLQLPCLSELQQLLITLVPFTVGENVAVGKIKHGNPAFAEQPLNRGCGAWTAAAMNKNAIVFLFHSGNIIIMEGK